MTRRHRWILFGAAAMLVVLVTPLLLSQVSFFRVRQIELVGVQYHEPDQLLKALEIEPDQNLFAAKRRIERNADKLASVLDVHIERKLPGTLKIVVAELQPAAFIATQTGLAVLDGAGNRLSYDPVTSGFDLPFVEEADSALLQALLTVRTADPMLFEQLDVAKLRRDGSVVLQVGQKQVLLNGSPTVSQIETLKAVRSHIAATGRGYNQLDARFHSQIVARGNGD